ncbi:MAG TPA: hypothetical protein VHI13_10650 [Candidatus Kapabacteria bacterium]|nr:hypothetical protein [Candidatus Kapabacteria bacterium]
MKASDDLFRLVKSLSKAEKRYFKLQATFYRGSKLYLALFDAIDAMESYNEASLKRQFAGMPLVRQFNVAKRYLYEQVMRSLRAYHTETTVRAEVRGLIHNIEILVDRGLTDQARKMAESAMELAREHEDHLAMLEVLAWNETLNPGVTDTDGGVLSIYAEVYTVVDAYRDLVDHNVAMRRLAVPFLPGALRSPKIVEELERLMKLHPGNAGPVLSVKARILDRWSRAMYHHALGDDAGALRFTREQMDLFDAHPSLIRSRITWYFAAASNHLMLLKRNGLIQEFWTLVEMLRERAQNQIGPRRRGCVRLQAHLFGTVYLNMLTLALGMDDRERFQSLAIEIEQGLRRLAPHLDQDYLLRFRSNLTLLYFELNDFERALEFNNAILNGPEPIRGREVYAHARLVNIVIHFELGHEDLLEYRVRSAYRYLRSRKIIHRFETIVLEMFRSLIRVRNRAELLELFIDIRNRLAPLENDPMECNAFRHFQYLTWLDRRIASLRAALPGSAHERSRAAA